MKKCITIILCVCLAVSITACSRRDSTKKPEISQSQSVSENPSIPSEQEEHNSPAFVEDDAFYQSILITYGGVIQTDEQNMPYLSSTKMGLFFAEDWENPKELSVGSYFTWYLTMVHKEDISIEERQEKYKSPFGEDTGWFFPQKYFEPLVQKYFNISTEYLRSDSTIYNAEHEGYYIDGGGGIGDTPVIVLNGVESDCDLRKLYVRLDYKYQDVESKVLTVKLEPDGGYTFVSYVTVGQETTSNNQELNPFYEKVLSEKSSLVELVRERVESYRNGTPPEATNHHPLYPLDFPPVNNLPDIQSTNDFSVRLTGNEDALGNVYLAVPIDGDCELYMTVSEYQDANNNLIWASGDTFFKKVSGIQWQTQDIDLYK